MERQVETRRAGAGQERAARPVNTFVVRRWQPDCAEARYEIAHVQSGRRTVAADLPTASAWIGGFGGALAERAAEPVAAV